MSSPETGSSIVTKTEKTLPYDPMWIAKDARFCEGMLVTGKTLKDLLNMLPVREDCPLTIVVNELCVRERGDDLHVHIELDYDDYGVVAFGYEVPNWIEMLKEFEEGKRRESQQLAHEVG